MGYGQATYTQLSLRGGSCVWCVDEGACGRSVHSDVLRSVLSLTLDMAIISAPADRPPPRPPATLSRPVAVVANSVYSTVPMWHICKLYIRWVQIRACSFLYVWIYILFIISNVIKLKYINIEIYKWASCDSDVFAIHPEKHIIEFRKRPALISSRYKFTSAEVKYILMIYWSTLE